MAGPLARCVGGPWQPHERNVNEHDPRQARACGRWERRRRRRHDLSRRRVLGGIGGLAVLPVLASIGSAVPALADPASGRHNSAAGPRHGGWPRVCPVATGKLVRGPERRVQRSASRRGHPVCCYQQVSRPLPSRITTVVRAWLQAGGTYGNFLQPRFPTARAYDAWGWRTSCSERHHLHPWHRRLLGPLVRPSERQGLSEDIAGNIIKMVRNQDFSTGLEPGPLLDYFPYVSPPPAS